MKIKLNIFLIGLLSLNISVGCAQTKETNIKEAVLDLPDDAPIYDPSKVVYFNEVLIYKYASPGEEGEFWVYLNTETGNLLFDPNDEMVDFVIADPYGTYYIFGENGHDEKVVTSQTVYGVTDKLEYDYPYDFPKTDQFFEFTKLSENRIIDRSYNFQPDIESAGYKMVYKKMTGQQNIFFTESIPVNAYLLYGFTRLGEELRIPIDDLFFVGVLSKNQLVTHIERDNLILKLENYGPNSYHAPASDYTYYVQKENGDWEKQDLPLLKSK
ncbi:MAG: hypothetical protein H0X63_01635 [Flavobacteriales bacterium]|jgi:hypothetical protein|nr:hypothetical protein [Flavobacteriales bacterium]